MRYCDLNLLEDYVTKILRNIVMQCFINMLCYMNIVVIENRDCIMFKRSYNKSIYMRFCCRFIFFIASSIEIFIFVNSRIILLILICIQIYHATYVTITYIRSRIFARCHIFIRYKLLADKRWFCIHFLFHSISFFFDSCSGGREIRKDLRQSRELSSRGTMVKENLK